MAKRCPRCGRYMENNNNFCPECGYGEKPRGRVCPRCGSSLIRGNCRNCGYKHGNVKGDNNVCPHCGQPLVNKYCYDCDYKKGETLKWFIVMVIMAIVAYMFFKEKGNF